VNWEIWKPDWTALARQQVTESNPKNASGNASLTTHANNGLEEGIRILLRAEEAGQPADLSDWLAHHPGLATELAEFIACQRGLQIAAKRWHDQNTPDTEGPPFKKTLGGLELGDEIDRGGMGIVYRAYDPELRRDVAVKRIITGPFTSADERARFRFEAEAAAGLNHPAVVPIYSFGEECGNPYLVMALMDGGSLANRLRELGANRRMRPLDAAELIHSVALGVHHAHQRGLIHRDLKPANILFNSQGTPHIADFGLAVTLEASFRVSLGKSMAGTAAYMAPEQVSGNMNLTTAVDVHALGAILYEILAGQPPFGNNEWLLTLQQVRDEAPKPLRDGQSKIPRDLESICMRCLEKAPQDRYPSAKALADDMERFMHGEPLQSRRPGWIMGLTRLISRRRITASMSSWPGCFFAVGLTILSHGIITWGVAVGAPALWSYLALGFNLAGWSGLYLWFLLARIEKISLVERASAAVQFGTIIACISLIPFHIQQHGWDIIPIYPPLTTVLGLGMFCHGATHWGKLYVAGVLLILVACLMPLLPSIFWPVAHALSLATIITWTGFKLREFDMTSRHPSNSKSS